MSILTPATLAARVTSTPYHAGSRLAGTAATDYEIRDTANHFFNIGLARDGVIDLGVSLDNSLNAALAVSVQALHDRTGVGSSVNSPGGILFSTVSGVDDMPTGGRWWVLPEATGNVVSSGTARHVEIPELRAPISALRLVVQARTTPDSGAFSLVAIRRY